MKRAKPKAQSKGSRSLDELAADPENPRVIGAAAQIALGVSLPTFGDIAQITWNARNGLLVTGHQRVAELRRAGATKWERDGDGRGWIAHPTSGERFAVRVVDWDERTHRRANLAANNPRIGGQFTDLALEQMQAFAGEDLGLSALLQFDALSLDWDALAEVGFVSGTEAVPGTNGTGEPLARPTLADRFLIPPFSVFDARQGYWQERKRKWLALGIQSELGRGGSASPGGSPRDAATLGTDGKTVRGDGKGRPALGLARCFGQDLMRGEGNLTWVRGNRSPAALDETSRKNLAAGRRQADRRSNVTGASPLPTWATGTGTENMATGTSIFDPVLCEIVYRWFSASGAQVLDPFAGGSVRGIVAGALGRRYTGLDLSKRQIEANREQARGIGAKVPGWLAPDWLCCDALGMKREGIPTAVDLVFSCPPYFDLERYSEEEKDLSNMTWPAFEEAYAQIVGLAATRLRDNRFACFVVGNVRDPAGHYRDLVGLTVDAFSKAGLAFYNDAILVTSLGSLPIRVGRQFEASRKLGKAHQNVLVFVKGDPALAADACGRVEVDPSLLEQPSQEGAPDAS